MVLRHTWPRMIELGKIIEVTSSVEHAAHSEKMLRVLNSWQSRLRDSNIT